ncbi:MAG: trigger factor [Bacteroidota bacterium]|nr:trigger factor [Bacteroidota bacterium]MDX5449248.1 trigger factor [Bacteroidota bacterium]MDX5505986.1 trigger factor [Bacteroidota bacterium]
MNISLKNQDELNAVLAVTIEPGDYQEKVDKTLENYRKQANIPGFRKGKVPAGLVRKQYGKSVMIDEVNHLLQHAVSDYLRDNKVDILGNPLPVPQTDINWDQPGEMTFEFELGLSPDFELKISGRNKVNYYKIVADKETVDRYVDDIAKRYGKLTQPEEPVETDMFSGTFVELEDGEVKEDGIEKKNQFMGSVLKTAKAKKALLALKPGESMDLDLKKDFNKDYNTASLIGVTDSNFEEMNAQFRFTLESVSRIEAAELNQELFDKVFGPGEVSSEEEFKARVKDDIEKMYKRDTDQFFMNEVSEYLLDKTSFDLPAEFLKKWIQTAGEEPLSSEQAEEEYPRMEKGLRWQLIENKIIRDNEIKVSQEELVNYTKGLVAAQMAQYGQQVEDAEMENIAKNVLQNQEEAERINDRLYSEKMKEFYLNTFKVEEKEVSYDDFAKLVSEQNA